MNSGLMTHVRHATLLALAGLCASIVNAQEITSATTDPPTAEEQPAPADSAAEAGSDEPSDMDTLTDELGTESDSLGSELLLFADIPVVVSASRRQQPLSLSPMPVSVLTAEDIHFGGLTNIPEALRFVPGVSVVRTDRNRYGVGVRGLNHWSSERTLTIVDGRDAELPFNNTPDWMAFPLFLEDINRIEVVRGPGGASWGANALNGVINIITKDPLDTQGVLLSSRINEFGDTHSFARWGAAYGKWSWRLSLGFVDQKSSQNAIIEDHFVSDDFRQQLIADTKAVYQATDDDKFSFGIGYSGTDQNDTNRNASIVGDAGDERLNDFRAFVRYDHTFGDGSTAHLQWAGQFNDRHQPAYLNVEAFTSNLDAQISLAKLGDHSITFGGNFRWTHTDLDSEPGSSLPFFPGRDALDGYAGGVFVQDRVDLADRWWLEGQFRVDNDSRTQTDWSGRIALLHALDGEQRHIVRLAAARSFRSLGLEYLDASRSNSFAGFIPSPNVINESVWAIEAGYNGQLAQGLSLRVDGYYQRYQDLLGLAFAAFVPIIEIIGVNNGDADAYGLETELAFTGEHGRFSLWYAYNAINYDDPLTVTRAYSPSLHNVGATARVFLGEGWTFNANYRYMDDLDFPQGSGYAEPLPPSHRFDIALAKSFADGLGEVQVGVEDLFNKTEVGGHEITAGAAETPGRTLFVRVQLKF